jgi:hypothetical protein
LAISAAVLRLQVHKVRRKNLFWQADLVQINKATAKNLKSCNLELEQCDIKLSKNNLFCSLLSF